jgi:hypothetical protein
MPFATSRISAPVASARFAISFTKEILVARNALAAYFSSSAVRRSVMRVGVSIRYKGA